MPSEVDAYVAVGSNICPESNIPRALDLLMECADVLAASTFYRTPPIERPDQDDYRNGVVHLRTEIPPHPLKFDILRGIERALGRVRSDDAYAARTIDLDLILYGDWVVDEPALRLPDPDIRNRAFVAGPLLELAPDLCLPDTGERLADVATPTLTTELRADVVLSIGLRARLRNE